MIKRLFDILFSIMGLVVFSISLPFIAVVIFLSSPGNVIFKQKRIGFGGRTFTIYKYRTMSHNKIISIGNFLRKTHIDELPQLLNILKGDMSFVGPRPEWIELGKTYEKEIENYQERYRVKPGIMGWAQINYPASHTVEEAREKFKYDLYYVEHQSFLFDMKIILNSFKSYFL